MSELVEVYSVIYRDKDGGGEAPSGTISAFDGKRGQIIYSRRRGQTGVSSHKLPSGSAAQNGKRDVQLHLTGPYRAILADGCVSIELDLHHYCKDRGTPYVAQIFVDIYSPSTEYDKIVTKDVRTCTCKDGPRAEVKYALLSDAVEAVVEAKLLTREQEEDPADCCIYVHRILATSDIGDVVLFLSDDESTRIGSSSKGPTTTTFIPLARSVLAVPTASPLTIVVELGHRSGGEMVEYFMSCHPDIDTEHVLLFACKIGVVEVKITCSD